MNCSFRLTEALAIRWESPGKRFKICGIPGPRLEMGQ